MRIQSRFAILDVKRGRKQLRKYFEDRGHSYRSPVINSDERIPVVIYGVIDGPWGRDDGESQEFEIEVDRVEINK